MNILGIGKYYETKVNLQHRSNFGFLGRRSCADSYLSNSTI